MSDRYRYLYDGENFLATDEFFDPYAMEWVQCGDCKKAEKYDDINYLPHRRKVVLQEFDVEYIDDVFHRHIPAGHIYHDLWKRIKIALGIGGK